MEPKSGSRRTASPGRYGGISQERHSLYAGRDLLKQIQPFAAEVEFIQHKTSGVAARPSEGFDKRGEAEPTSFDSLLGNAWLRPAPRRRDATRLPPSSATPPRRRGTLCVANYTTEPPIVLTFSD